MSTSHSLSDRQPDTAFDTLHQHGNEAPALRDTVRAIHRDLAHELDASMCFFGVYHADAQIVDVVWQVQDGVELPGGAFPLGSGLTSQVIRERQPRLVGNWSSDGPPVQVQYATEPPSLPQAALTVPVTFEDRVLGVISVQSPRPAAFDYGHLELVQRLVERAAPVIAASLQTQQPADGAVQTALDPVTLVARAEDAAVALDIQGRLVGMNQAARELLALQDDSVVFGFPIDQPQGGQWPLGSPTLGEALRSLLDRIQLGEASPETQIAPQGEAGRVVRCCASMVVEGGQPAGAVMTFRGADSSSRARGGARRRSR